MQTSTSVYSNNGDKLLPTGQDSKKCIEREIYGAIILCEVCKINGTIIRQSL
jgi:hypothetical protein